MLRQPTIKINRDEFDQTFINRSEYFPVSIFGTFYGIPVTVSIDTGSCLSFMSYELFKKIRTKRPFIYLTEAVKESTAADRSQLKMLGAVRLDIKFKGVSTNHLFHVCEDMLIPSVLGVDFLHSQKCVVDFIYKVLRFRQSGKTLKFNFNSFVNIST